MKIFFQLFAVAAFFLGIQLVSADISHDADAASESTPGVVEINIRNSTFEFHGGILRPDQPTRIVIHNLDKIKHGFTSTLLAEMDIQVESEGVTTLGKGIKAVHIDPGKTVQIQFLPNRVGRFSFQCDIHPDMKGEFLILSIEAI